MTAAVRLFVPEDSLAPPRYQRKLPKSLTEAQEGQIVQFARDQLDYARAGKTNRRKKPNGVKIRAAERDLFALLFDLGTGLRVAELCDLLVGDVDLIGRTVHVTHGKGDKERYVPITDRLVAVVRDWIGLRREGYMITTDRGRPFVRCTMYWRMRRLGAHAGIPKVIGVHTLRHTFAQRVFDKTENLEVVRALLGHESIATTQIYAQASMNAMRKAVEALET